MECLNMSSDELESLVQFNKLPDPSKVDTIDVKISDFQDKFDAETLLKYQGKLVQEYSFADRAYQPRDANELLDAGSFSFTIDGGLVTLDIDGKSFDLYVRSAQDGTAEGGAS